MDKGKRVLGAVFWSICLLILILDTKTAIAAASEGIQLCIRVLIPSIFPFLVICPMVSANTGILSMLLRPLGRLMRLPRGAEHLYVLSLLSGYPVGAANVSRAVRSGQISRKDGQRLLAFCNNAGPSFLFGIGISLFPNAGYCAMLWLIHILSSIAVAVLTPGKSEAAACCKQASPPFTAILPAAISTMATICGWVVLFRIGIAFLDRWILWIVAENGQILLRGLLELANGMVSLAGIGSIGQRMILFSMLVGFGGICVWMQTVSVCQGVSMIYYLPGKLTQSVLSVLLSTAFQLFLPLQYRYWPNPILLAFCTGICALYPIVMRKIEKRSGNSSLVGV